MQTFLPSSRYNTAASMLDNKRLNKQILECYQILNVLSGRSKTNAWRNHPAVLMWEGNERGLWRYVQAMITEAKSRGIRTENNEKNLNELKDKCWNHWQDDTPEYFTDQNKMMRIVTTHRANLFNKDPLYYAEFQYALHSPYNTACCPDRKQPCKYYWPTHE